MALAGRREARERAPGTEAGEGPGDGRAPTVLVLRALGLGDLLTAVPALRALRAHHPHHRLALAAPGCFTGLAGLVGGIDTVVPAHGPVAPPWSGRPPDLAVNLHGSGPESIAALRALRPRRLWTHAHPGHPGPEGPAWRPDLHEVERWCRLLDHYGLRADPADLCLDRPSAPCPRPGAVVVHPGAAHPARRWPEDRFARVARHLADRGRDVVVTGTPRERGGAVRVARAAGLGEHAVLAGRTGLEELAALVAGAALVVCGDTGIAHLATAYATPSVVLFGPTPPALWGPPAHRTCHVVLWKGRVGDPFGTRTDPGLLGIGAESVIGAAERLLARTRPADTTPTGAHP